MAGSLGNVARAIGSAVRDRKTEKAVQELLNEASQGMSASNYGYKDYYLSASRRKIAQDPRVQAYGELVKKSDQQKQGAARGGAARDVVQGLGAPQQLPETGSAPGAGSRTSSPIPQEAGVLGADTGQFQALGQPPKTQEAGQRAYGEFVEAGQAPESTSQQLGETALGTLPTDKEAFERDLKQRRELRMTDTAKEKNELAKANLQLKFRNHDLNLANHREKTIKNRANSLYEPLKKVMTDASNQLKDLRIKREKTISDASDVGNMKDVSNLVSAYDDAIKNAEIEERAADVVSVYVTDPLSKTGGMNKETVNRLYVLAQKAIENGTFTTVQSLLQAPVLGGGQPAPALGGGQPAPTANPDPMGLGL